MATKLFSQYSFYFFSIFPGWFWIFFCLYIWSKFNAVSPSIRHQLMYEIPKISVAVELLLVNNETITGNMFVTEDIVSAGGNPLMEEFLNEDGDQFFPFESSAGVYRLINKQQVVFIRTDQTDSETKEKTPIEPKNLVAHLTNERTIYGLVYPTLAEESRVSDIINENVDFIAIYQDGLKIIINRRHVIYISAN